VYIPTLTGGETLAACLEALQAQTVKAEVVVADNGPGEGCAVLLEEHFPAATRISFGGRNLGFGAALNRAVRSQGEGPVILLNDDTVPAPNFVESLLETWEHSGCEMIAGVLLKAADPRQIDSAGIVCDQVLMAWDYLTGEPTSALEEARDPIGPTGAGALLDRSAFEAVGGFDEHLFLYYEDVDLALRMRSAGMNCRLATEARATHTRSATLGNWADAKFYHTGFSRGYLLRKYGISRHPALALKSCVSDGSAVVGQLILNRSFAGGHGRIAGWRAGRQATRTELPIDELDSASLRRHLQVRMARRGIHIADRNAAFSCRSGFSP